MKRAWIAISLLVLIGVVGTGCMGVASPVQGVLVIDDVGWDGAASGPLGPKEGEACAQSYLALFATGDASVKAAAAKGGITNVMSVDHRSKWLLFFGEYCTIVRGS